MDEILQAAKDIATTDRNPITGSVKDDRFVDAIKSKNICAFELFYDKYAPAYYGEIKRSLYKDEDSKKILKKAFETIWNTIEQYDESKENLFVWGLKIVKKETSRQKVDLLLKHIFSY